MKKHLKVLVFVLAATLAAGVFALGACKGVQDEKIVEDSGSYISVREI